ncbi:molybdopterin cofactor-binding domain-containing protein [Rhizobium sp. NPDC090275]|uniref:xanthine dehydrogenase family protein molybdopterin-binding subunit n=1 Tax=Rhizobium sp. NPDC090275 TaxID=3364498 RepID=UPI00383A3E0D
MSKRPSAYADGLSRRAFLAGAGLVVGFSLVKAARANEADDLKAIGAYDAAGTGFKGFTPDGFIRIGVDGTIVLVVPSVEMGQGIATAEAMMIAEELEVQLDQVKVEMSPPDPTAYNQALLKGQVTGGSTSTRAFFTPLRKAGAAAREMLVAAAAAEWQVNPFDCRAELGVVYHDASRRNAKYAELALAAGRQSVPADVKLKPVEEFKLIGRSLKRVDTPSKVNGKTKYGIDTYVEGMRYAALAMAPTIGGKVRSIAEGTVRQMDGIVDVLRIDNAVAVVATSYWIAKKALDQIDIDWDAGPNAGLSTEAILNDLRSATGTPLIGSAKGDADAAIASAPVRVDASYELPYLAHASLEPINTTIHVRADSCDIWVGTQVPEIARTVVAEIIGMPPEKIMLYNHMVGGGFGRRLAVDTIQQAARFAKQVDYPLKIMWTREQDIEHDRFRPIYVDRISAGLGKDGKPVALIHRTTCSTVRPFYDRKEWPANKLDPDAVAGAADLPYGIPNTRSEWLRHDGPVPLNWWRGVGETHNIFVVESFIDELAHRAGVDPIAYRRSLLALDPRTLRVLDRVEKLSNWDAPLPRGGGRGVSIHDSFGSHAAVVVEIKLDDIGMVSLQKVSAVVDCGLAINPDGVVAQMQGGILFGLSAALYNGITIKEGKVEQRNFNDYRQLRLNETPEIIVEVIKSTEPPGGLGEVGTVSAAPALCNAIFAATGQRLRSLPVNRALLHKRQADQRNSFSLLDGGARS